MVSQIINETLSYSEKDRINLYTTFFKCFPGGYGEGDSFAGIRNPVLRSLSKKYKAISLEETTQLLIHKIHEIRLLALFIFEIKVKNKKTSLNDKNEIASIYLSHLDFINNWDLVDSSAQQLLGSWTFHKSPQPLISLAQSNHLWRNRIAMIATFYYIRQNSFDVPFEIALLLLHHPHDLIHKAVGWMLREIGKRDSALELEFLKQHYKSMPRTMLRYAIEKFDEPLRQEILKGNY